MTIEKDVELADINVSSGESDNEEGDKKENEERHKKLLNDLDENLGIRKKRQYTTSRSEPSADISEYNWSSSSGKVTLQDLVGSLDSKCRSVSKIKKKLRKMENKTKVMEKPLEKVERERVERTVAYQETAKDISKWHATIQKNREAEHISFPLGVYKPPPVSTKNIAIEFKPQNEMEEEISKILSGSKHLLERKDKELTEAEEKALQTVDLEEALERRKELQKNRALQSYYEAKCRRAKKIKSKKYHRILKKEQQKALGKIDLEKLSKENPELFHSELEKAERMRAMERANLRHRNSSKWAKNLITKGRKTKEDQERIREQLRISRELTEHKTADDSDTDEDNEHDTENGKPGTELTLLKGSADEENPWLLGNSNTEKIDSEDTSICFKKLRPIVTSESTAAIEDDKDADFSTDDEWDSAGEKLSNAKDKSTKEKNLETSSQKNCKEESRSGDESKENHEDADSMESDQEYEGLEPIKNTSDVIPINATSKDKHDSSKVNKKKSKKLSKVDKRAEILKSESNVLELDNVGDSSDDEGVTFDNTEQTMNIREAFANDDVIGDFLQEKDEIVESSKPKPVDLTLPGWGEWGGAGLTVSKKKRKRFTKDTGPARKRRDDGIANIIINEDGNKCLASHQVSSVPFPYGNKEEFERSIRQPIGEHWNTPSVHQKLIEPRIQTTPGVPIDPMKASRRMKKKFKDASRVKK